MHKHKSYKHKSYKHKSWNVGKNKMQNQAAEERDAGFKICYMLVSVLHLCLSRRWRRRQHAPSPADPGWILDPFAYDGGGSGGQRAEDGKGG